LAAVRARKASEKIWDPFFSATVEARNFKFCIQLGLGEEHTKKQLLGPQLAGVRARRTSKKNLRPPYLFLQSLKLASSNLLYNLGLGRVWAREH